MAYTSKLQALDAICRSHGGSGGHVRTIRALNEWCVLLGGAGGRHGGVDAAGHGGEDLHLALAARARSTQGPMASTTASTSAWVEV